MAEAHLAFGDINAMSMYSETSAAKASSSPRFRPHCREEGIARHLLSATHIKF